MPYKWPFKINAELLETGGILGFFSVRTTSWEFSGERTDLHDVLSLLLAANLRVRDIVSAGLLTEVNSFSGIDSEIYARIVAPFQEGAIASLCSRSYFQALSRESFAADALARDVLELPVLADPEDRGDATYEPEPDWVVGVRRTLRLKVHGDYEYRVRTLPDWRVLTSVARGASAAELGRSAIDRLRDAFAGFRPQVADSPGHRAYRTDALLNAIPLRTLAKAERLLRAIEPDLRDPLVVPIETHAIVIGRTALAAIAAPCGSAAFEDSRSEADHARRTADQVFLRTERFEWSDHPDPERFEAMIGELLEREPGMHWIRQVGGTREGDDGRDFMAEWESAPTGGLVEGVSDGQQLTERRHILVQVKISRKGCVTARYARHPRHPRALSLFGPPPRRLS